MVECLEGVLPASVNSSWRSGSMFRLNNLNSVGKDSLETALSLLIVPRFCKLSDQYLPDCAKPAVANKAKKSVRCKAFFILKGCLIKLEIIELNSPGESVGFCIDGF